MEKREGEEIRPYLTKSPYKSGFLFLNGHKPSLRFADDGSVEFSFEVSPKLLKLLGDFNAGVPVDVKAYTHAVQSMRRRIIAFKTLRGDNK